MKINPKEIICYNCENFKENICQIFKKELTNEEIYGIFAETCEMFSCSCWKENFNEKYIERALNWHNENATKYPKFFNLIDPFPKNITLAYSSWRKNGSEFNPSILKDLK